MQLLQADLHIHSVLSPCGGLEMSPMAVVQKLKENGINWMAITDHNSMANCAAYAKVARDNGLYYTWGVEIQSFEEIHILAYWDDEQAAKEFDNELYSSLLPLLNDPDFCGDQVIIDENENILRVEQRALINSSQWDLSTVVERVLAHGGFAVPAHIDASVNSIISQLGFMPEEPVFELFGITGKLDTDAWIASQPFFAGKRFLRASDAHYLCDLGKGSSRIFAENGSVQELVLAARNAGGRYIKV